MYCDRNLINLVSERLRLKKLVSNSISLFSNDYDRSMDGFKNKYFLEVNSVQKYY